MTEGALPPLVARAQALAARRHFEKSCTDATGRVLRALAAAKPGGSILEIGTGAGVGTAWMIDGMRGAGRILTVDVAAESARDAEELFQDLPYVRVMHGDYREALSLGPFDLVFADGGGAKSGGAELVAQALRRGGIVVIDDLTPPEFWPEEWRGRPDPVREFWLKDGRFAATELFEDPRRALVIAVRV